MPIFFKLNEGNINFQKFFIKKILYKDSFYLSLVGYVSIVCLLQREKHTLKRNRRVARSSLNFRKAARAS